MEELFHGIDYYEDTRPGLGLEFMRLVEGKVRLIAEHPGVGAIVPLHRQRTAVRRFAMGRFPYLVIYAIREDVIFIIALAHTSRRPLYWRRRLQ